MPRAPPRLVCAAHHASAFAPDRARSTSCASEPFRRPIPTTAPACCRPSGRNWLTVHATTLPPHGSGHAGTAPTAGSRAASRRRRDNSPAILRYPSAPIDRATSQRAMLRTAILPHSQSPGSSHRLQKRARKARHSVRRCDRPPATRGRLPAASHNRPRRQQHANPTPTGWTAPPARRLRQSMRRGAMNRAGPLRGTIGRHGRCRLQLRQRQAHRPCLRACPRRWARCPARCAAPAWPKPCGKRTPPGGV
jgi:hypothetical protein